MPALLDGSAALYRVHGLEQAVLLPDGDGLVDEHDVLFVTEALAKVAQERRLPDADVPFDGDERAHLCIGRAYVGDAAFDGEARAPCC